MFQNLQVFVRFLVRDTWVFLGIMILTTYHERNSNVLWSRIRAKCSIIPSIPHLMSNVLVDGICTNHKFTSAVM